MIHTTRYYVSPLFPEPGPISDWEPLYFGFQFPTASSTYAMGNLISSNKFDPSKDLVDLAGKVVIVTGGK